MKEKRKIKLVIIKKGDLSARTCPCNAFPVKGCSVGSK